MSDDLDEINPKHIPAVFDRSDDVDVPQGDLAQDLARRAVRVGGIIRRHLTGAHATQPGRKEHYVRARNLDFRASRQRSFFYKLNTNGLAKAAAIAFRALRDLVALRAMSTFCRQQTTGGRPRAEFVDPVARDVPLLTAVLVGCLAAWRTLSAGIGKLLFCDRQIVQRWWRDISTRLARSLAFNPSCDYLGTVLPERLMTTVRPPDTSAPKSPVGLLRRL
ncbi:DUF2478 domain-containing protein [Bradyrhizobium acaciae]|uniref:DUF2478 domain-containing protein n=1 Tax=Bradyrhizobium acaciae TaxID=2683706 RepID=UPI001E636498|nr:DUF2478 domain-containing protein [Bradyrhizobium acaciae]MCC8978045.1 DUF2478 domain-containing protein [Bradyrhizobium acaciae]